MAGMDLQISNIILIVALILVVVGLVFAVMFYFKRAENLSDEDRLNIERAKVAWIGAGVMALLVLVAGKKEGKWLKGGLLGGNHKSAGASSLL